MTEILPGQHDLLILDTDPKFIQISGWSHAAEFCFELMELLGLTCSSLEQTKL